MSRVSKLASLPVSLPKATLPQDVDPTKVALQHSDILSLVQDPLNFLNDAVWRDHFALTGTLRSFYSAKGITEAWHATIARICKPDPSSFKVLPEVTQKVELPNGTAWIEMTFTFEADLSNGLRGECTGMLSLVPASNDTDGGKWKIWVMRTILDSIKGFPDVDVGQPKQIVGTTNTYHANGTQQGTADSTAYFDTVVVGGGPSGLSTAGRLQALDVSYVVIDKNEHVGDSWKTRYNSVKLHTSREYAHLPFDRTFPNTYNEMLTKDELAQGYQNWVKKYGIDEHIWLETVLESGIWDNTSKSWTLKIRRHSQEQTIKCKFLVMSVGFTGNVQAATPQYPGQESFHGTVMHSVDYKSPEAWKGKRGVIVGTANTAHDIAEDMLKAGLAYVTMVQRSPTYVLPYEHLRAMQTRTYNENIPTALADKLQHTGSLAVARLIVMMALHAMATQEIERFEALSRAGFLTDTYGDLFFHIFTRGGGHYIDVGNGANIVKGLVKIKSDAAITSFTPEGLSFSDGSTLPADVVIFATGFNTNKLDMIQSLLGDDVTDQFEDFRALDDEGEIQGMWKLQHPGLICHGSEQAQARYYSRYIALQIKAALAAGPFETYLETPVPPNKVQVNGNT